MDTTATTHKLLALYSSAQVRAFDRRAIEEQGLAGYEALMVPAGRAAFTWLQKQWPWVRKLLVVCGGGNNAGDGYVLARLAKQAGLTVTVAYLIEPQRLKGDASQAWQDATDAGVACVPFEAQQLAGHELVVDALLGTGLERPLEDAWHDAVTAINAAKLPVLAIDIPSGLHADTGSVLGAAVEANMTVTFIAHKIGLYTGEAAQHVGQIRFDDLRVPEQVFSDTTPVAHLLDQLWVRQWLPQRSRTAHKGHFGYVLVIGGQEGMAGAVRLAGEAAARAGAGLVSIATDPSHAATISAARPELMAKGISDPAALNTLSRHASVISLGPGLGQGAWGEALFAHALPLEIPLVLDADGLNLLAKFPERRDDWILTPHPGEAARLLRCTTQDIQADRLAAARALQEKYGGVVVLKGAGTLIDDGNSTLVSDTGNPGMASGGMGDVLTGVIAGLLAQGLPPLAAAAAGVYLHGAAADRAARNGGERGLLASDLLAELRSGMNPRHD